MQRLKNGLGLLTMSCTTMILLVLGSPPRSTTLQAMAEANGWRSRTGTMGCCPHGRRLRAISYPFVPRQESNSTHQCFTWTSSTSILPCDVIAMSRMPMSCEIHARSVPI